MQIEELNNPYLYVALVIIICLFTDVTTILRAKKPKSSKYNYKQIDIFTQFEQEQYFFLKQCTDSLNLSIFPKVRLADLIQAVPRTDKIARAKIQSEHIDFVVYDNQLNIVVCINLITKNSGKSDAFIAKSLSKAGINFIKVNNTLDIENILNSY